MLNEAEKIHCREFVTANDVASGNYKLNLGFVANLFNRHPNLPDPGADEIGWFMVEFYKSTISVDLGPQETREEKTYRNWMNSMGVQPYVNYLYEDLKNGLVIFQLYDIIRPGMVQWKRVVKEFTKLRGMMDQIQVFFCLQNLLYHQNCNYAVELGKQLRFSLVGIQGKDIFDAIKTLTLGNIIITRF